MANFRTNYTYTTPVSFEFSGSVALKENGKGGVDILIEGQKALTLTSTGYLRRHAMVGATGFRLLDNRKIAMKADDGSSD